MNVFSTKEIEKILIQLEEKKLLFATYSFVKKGEGLCLLGQGSSAHIYEAKRNALDKKKYAVKIIGFKSKIADSDLFEQTLVDQISMGMEQNNIVKIFGKLELWVSFDDNDDVISATKHKPVERIDKLIKLQFIVMEKLSLVIEHEKDGNLKVIAEPLKVITDPDYLKRAFYSEKVVLKFAYDIGCALVQAHSKKILHRDIKLENVFYDEKRGCYKLGDFGIAKKTKDGFADTIAFTKGYVAPEVKVAEVRYDNTADIYSFGIMLYILMNQLKFPASNIYAVNLTTQYSSGYVVPKPEGAISDEFYEIIRKACSYDANKRYQSIEEMLLEIEALMGKVGVESKVKQSNAYSVIGILFVIVGGIILKYARVSVADNLLTFGQCFLCAASLLRIGMKNLHKKTGLISAVIVLVAIFLACTTGFTWSNLLFLGCLVFSTGIFSAGVGAICLATHGLVVIQQNSTIAWEILTNYPGIELIFLSIGGIFLYQYLLTQTENRKFIAMFYEKNLFWIIMCMAYSTIIIWDKIYFQGLVEVPDNKIIAYLETANLQWVGLIGLFVCLFLIGREKVSILLEKRKN